MAPEIQTKIQLIYSARIVDMRKIDMQALTMTLFLIANPDLSYPYEYDVKELQNKFDGKTFCISAE